MRSFGEVAPPEELLGAIIFLIEMLTCDRSSLSTFFYPLGEAFLTLILVYDLDCSFLEIRAVKLLLDFSLSLLVSYLFICVSYGDLLLPLRLILPLEFVLISDNSCGLELMLEFYYREDGNSVVLPN